MKKFVILSEAKDLRIRLVGPSSACFADLLRMTAFAKNKTTRDIEPYRKARKPMPRPTRVKPDEREKIKRRLSEREQRKGSENKE